MDVETGRSAAADDDVPFGPGLKGVERGVVDAQGQTGGQGALPLASFRRP